MRALATLEMGGADDFGGAAGIDASVSGFSSVFTFRRVAILMFNSLGRVEKGSSGCSVVS